MKGSQGDVVMCAKQGSQSGIRYGRAALLFVGALATAWCGSSEEGNPAMPKQTEEPGASFCIIREASRVLLFADPEIRGNHLRGALSHESGDQARVLRLLWWARETEPDLRKELMLQWLCERGTRPNEPGAPVKDALRELLRVYKPKEVAQRMREIDELWPMLDEEGAKRAHSRKEVGLSGGNPLLAGLSEATLLSGDLSARRATFGGLPQPVSKEEDNLVAGGVLVVLWLLEPDDSLRKEMLLPRMQTCFPSLASGAFRTSYMDRGGLLAPMKHREARARERELRLLEKAPAR